MSTDVVRHAGARAGSEMEQVEVAFRIGQAAARAGNYKSKNEAELALRVKYGMEMGLGPATALQSVTVINGSPALTAGAIASKLGGHPQYDYEVTEHTDERCTIVVYRHKRGEWRACPPSTFTMQDAQTAGLVRQGPWKNYPKNMLFARALTNAARWHAAEVFGGPIYTPDELGAEVDEEGAVVSVPAQTSAQAESQAPEPIVEQPQVLPAGDDEYDPKAIIEQLKTEFGADVVKRVFTEQGITRFGDLTPEKADAIVEQLSVIDAAGLANNEEVEEA
jgi:hypothetical protein